MKQSIFGSWLDLVISNATTERVLCKMTTERAELAAEIKEFIEKHANISPSYDPEHDDPEDRFIEPDASLMNHAALALEEDREFSFVHSDWGSGCYSPYGE